MIKKIILISSLDPISREFVKQLSGLYKGHNIQTLKGLQDSYSALPMLIAKYFLRCLSKHEKIVFLFLSARVESIKNNHSSRCFAWDLKEFIIR